MIWAWALLVLAVVSEVTATVSLRFSMGGRRSWLIVVVAAYALAFFSLAVILRLGMPLGVAYGIWSASGVAVTAVIGHRLFGEKLGPRALAGIALIVVGVLLIDMGGTH